MSATENTVRATMPASPESSPRDLAASAWVEAKRREDKAKSERLAAEENICKLFGVKVEGSQTESTEFFKVTTTGGMTRTIDADRLAEIAKSIPKAIREKVLRTKVEPVLAELRKLEESNPDVYRTLAVALTMKPAKPSVKVEIIA